MVSVAFLLKLCRYLKPCRSHICLRSLYSCLCSTRGSLSSVWFLSCGTSQWIILLRRCLDHIPNSDQAFRTLCWLLWYLRDLQCHLSCNLEPCHQTLCLSFKYFINGLPSYLSSALLLIPLRRFPYHIPDVDQGCRIFGSLHGYLCVLRCRLWCSHQLLYFSWCISS